MSAEEAPAGGESVASAAAKVAAILVAAGRGERAESDIPKQFLPLEGRPLFIHALAVLAASPVIAHITLVVPREWERRAQDMVEAAELVRVNIVAGGPRRQDSVWQGLQTLATGTLVLVHDAARPCLSAALVERTIEAARRCGAATAALPITDTVMRADATKRSPVIVDRTGLWAVQTPQVFEVGLLQAAHARARAQGTDASDDGTLVLGTGHELAFVPGDWSNIKVTEPKDLERARWILRSGGIGADCGTSSASTPRMSAGDAGSIAASAPRPEHAPKGLDP